MFIDRQRKRSELRRSEMDRLPFTSVRFRSSGAGSLSSGLGSINILSLRDWGKKLATTGGFSGCFQWLDLN